MVQLIYEVLKILAPATPALPCGPALPRRGEILTFRDTLTNSPLLSQGLSLWSLNIAGGEILTFPDRSHYSGVIPMVFEHSGGRDFDLPRHSHSTQLSGSGVIPMVFEHSAVHARCTY